MARIVYGVSSEGMGHATRSHAVITYLLKKGHDVHILTSDRAYDFFAGKYGERVHRIKGFHLIYEDNKLSNTKSTLAMLKTLSSDLRPTFRTLADCFTHLRPHVVISDFDVFSALFGRWCRIPVIAANNISIVHKTRIDLSGMKLNYSRLTTKWSSKLATVKADHYVIPTFFYPPTKRRNVHLTAPVVRDIIVKRKPTRGKHILVYQTSPTCLRLLRTLKDLDETFYVYGFGKRPREGNLHFFPFNDTTFIDHLASSKAVITGGGFSLISEALYLKKPILSVPLRDHFEQINNGHQLQRLHYGEYNVEPAKDDVEGFLLKLPSYQHTLDKYSFDPHEFPTTIEALVRQVARKPDERRMRRICRIVRTLS